MSYTKHLNDFYSIRTFNPGKEDVIKLITEQMQNMYPGNYIVVEYYDTVRIAFAARLEFNTPEDETMFILKWG